MNESSVQTFVQLLTQNYKRIYGYILSMVVNSNDAEDIMQETSSTMWDKFGEFTPGTDFVAWGRAIARYRVLEYRKKCKRNSVIHYSDSTLEILEKDATRKLDNLDDYMKALRSCVGRLGAQDKSLVLMRYEQGEPVKMIAQRISRTVQAVYRNLGRVQEMLMRCIQRTLKSEGL